MNTKEISVIYKGNKLDIEYIYQRGDGFFGNYVPYDEDEVTVTNVLNWPQEIDLSYEDIREIERIILEKVRD